MKTCGIHKMLEDPEVKEEKRTLRNSHSNLEIIFGNVLLIVCLEKETKGGTIKLFYLIMKADKYLKGLLAFCGLETEVCSRSIFSFQ
jgi:hypothetical protein